MVKNTFVMYYILLSFKFWCRAPWRWRRRDRKLYSCM